MLFDCVRRYRCSYLNDTVIEVVIASHTLHRYMMLYDNKMNLQNIDCGEGRRVSNLCSDHKQGPDRYRAVVWPYAWIGLVQVEDQCETESCVLLDDIHNQGVLEQTSGLCQAPA